ncbi:HEAT repeat domain-containing protein [Leptolyngbya sp. FACHB-261]|uniref:HEAT repeat domain-containing protein n=1 Tax=Leptolyngbya sp. FACHB-261 TaxID=2692806 RepID=UPI0016861712|nr:HEAT repeat domain-containing protein [Leptolyngbya sp. FACHB-261]MBD2102944.1 HEAT repeat domain-containing protein [Leptolyngbya sp. FACHB-261]
MSESPLELARAALASQAWAEALDHLRPLLTEPDPTLAHQATRLIAQVPHPLSVSALVGALDHSEAPIRLTAAEGLAQLGDRSALDPLLQALDDPEPAVRQQVVTTLKALDAEAARAQITELLSWERLPDQLRLGLTEALAGWEESGTVEVQS